MGFLYTDPEHKEPPIENMSTAHDIVTLGKYMYDHYENQVTRITTMQVYNDTKRILHIITQIPYLFQYLVLME